jgi:hypothetical protein
MLLSRPLTRDPARWVITGMGEVRLKPGTEDIYPGQVTLTRAGVGLDAVTYEGLQPGVFMKKWLLLDPIKVEVGADDGRDRDQIIEDAFQADHIDPVTFDPDVIVDGQSHQWSILSAEGDKIDLGKVLPGEHQLTYAWAQINMPEERSAILGIGSDSIVKVWLNGELVHENSIPHPIVVDGDRVPVVFKPGANQLVIKIQNTIWAWGFCCRLLAE